MDVAPFTNYYSDFWSGCQAIAFPCLCFFLCDCAFAIRPDLRAGEEGLPKNI